jgi:hypothetical protein
MRLHEIAYSLESEKLAQQQPNSVCMLVNRETWATFDRLAKEHGATRILSLDAIGPDEWFVYVACPTEEDASELEQAWATFRRGQRRGS